VLVEAYVNLFTFPFIAELFFVPFVAFLAALIMTAEIMPQLKGKEYDKTRDVLGGTRKLIAYALFAYVTINVVFALSNIDSLGERLLLPIWLNVALIPFMFLFSVRLIYSAVFTMCDSPEGVTKESARRAKLALLLSVGARPYILNKFGPPWPQRLNQAETLAEARNIAKEFLTKEANSAPIIIAELPQPYRG
jgi:hypothetical protein